MAQSGLRHYADAVIIAAPDMLRQRVDTCAYYAVIAGCHDAVAIFFTPFRCHAAS